MYIRRRRVDAVDCAKQTWSYVRRLDVHVELIVPLLWRGGAKRRGGQRARNQRTNSLTTSPRWGTPPTEENFDSFPTGDNVDCPQINPVGIFFVLFNRKFAPYKTKNFIKFICKSDFYCYNAHCLGG